MGDLHEDQYTCLITSCSTLLGMTNVFSEQSYREDQNTHFCSILFLEGGGMYCYETMRKNIVELGRPEMTI
jgi:hypothetical protein